jgi:hypothetical protein
MVDTTSAAYDEPNMKQPATHQVAEMLLQDVLGRYGKSACDTPQMLETLLRKHGRACPQEVDVLSSALRCGTVADLRSNAPTETGALARVLTLNARVPQPQAEWAVGAWTSALATAPDKVTPPAHEPAAAQAQATSPLRAGLVLAAAAATGAIAYLTFGP